MRNKALIIISALFLFAACGPRQDSTSEVHEPEVASDFFTFEHDSFDSFYQNLKSLCGKSFAGQQVYMMEGRESWEGREMVMHITKCDDDVIHVPFHMGEDQSRTWMFFNEDGKLRFRHDHRHEDGTPEDLTMYGGYADATRGNAYKQVFPADEYTLDVHPRSLKSEWIVEFKDDMNIFSYQLHDQGELLFEAQFNLSNPL